MSICKTAFTVVILTAAAVNASEPDVALNAYPQIRLGKIAGQEVEAAEEVLAKTEAEILKEVDDAIAIMALDKPEAEKLAIEGMRQVAARGRDLSKKLIQGHANYVAQSEQLKEVYTRSPGTFRDTAKVFRSRAGEATREENKQFYMQLADTWESLALRCEKRKLEMAAEDKAIADAMIMVKETGQLLELLEVHLAALPKLAAEENRQKFLEQLRRYIKLYDGLRESLGKYNEKIKQQSLAPDARQKSAEAVVPADAVARSTVAATPVDASIPPAPKPIPVAPRNAASSVNAAPPSPSPLKPTAPPVMAPAPIPVPVKPTPPPVMAPASKPMAPRHDAKAIASALVKEAKRDAERYAPQIAMSVNSGGSTSRIPVLHPSVSTASALPANAVPIGEYEFVQNGITYRVRMHYTSNPSVVTESVARR